MKEWDIQLKQRVPGIHKSAYGTAYSIGVVDPDVYVTFDYALARGKKQTQWSTLRGMK